MTSQKEPWEDKDGGKRMWFREEADAREGGEGKFTKTKPPTS
jgi:hypothetical protein